MSNNKALLLGGLGLATIFLLPKISAAAQPSTPNNIISVAGTSNIKTINLEDISGADWAIPLYLTVERNLALGLWGTDYLYTGVSTLYTGVKAATQDVGELLSTALSFSNSVARDIVVPSIISASKTTAKIITNVPKYTWSGLKTVGSGIYYVGGKIYDGTTWVGKTAWDIARETGKDVWKFVAGSWQKVTDLYKESHIFRDTTKALIGIAATAAVSIHGKPKSDTTTEVKPSTIPLGYLSKTLFDGALPVTKMYNSIIKDTRLVTDHEAIDKAKKLSYKKIATLGYCAAKPFRHSTQIFQLFNKVTLDSIIVTNAKILPKLVNSGYESQGIIGYCKALA